MSNRKCDRAEAERYLNLLDPTATGFCFWAGHDKNKDAKPWQRYGTLADRWADIERLNRAGYGIFVTVNATDATGRRQARNVQAVRAIWHEDDEGYNGTFPLPPHFTVQSSPGKCHRYWLTEGLSAEDHAGLLDVMCAKFRGDNGAKGINRVLRLPGTWHQKGAAHSVKIIETNETALAWGARSRSELLAAFGPLPERKASTPGPISESNPDEVAHIARALECVEATEYKQWLDIGMALHHHYSGDETGFDLWDKWSSGAPNYDGDATRAKWDGFDSEREGGLTIGTLYQAAKNGGWLVGKWRDPAIDAESFGPVPAGLVPPAVPRLPFGARVKRVGLTLDEVKCLPKKQWISFGLFERGETVVLAAAGGAGKSQYSLAAAVAVSSGDGRNLGFDVREQGGVLIINAEDKEEDVQKRLSAIEVKHGVPISQLPIFSYDGNNERFVAVERDDKGLRETQALQELTAWCLEYNPAVVIVDPLAKTHRAKENDNAEMTFVVDAFNKLARKTGAAVLLIHHTNKPPKADAGGREGDQNVSRGASAIIDGVRNAKTLFTMDAKSAGLNGVLDRERSRYFRVDDAKANHAAKNSVPQWYRIEGIPLPNGETAPAISLADFRRDPNEEEIEAAVMAAIVSAAADSKPFPANPKSAASATCVIADQLSIPKETITGALIRLERDGKIKRGMVSNNSKQVLRWLPIEDGEAPEAESPDGAD